MEDKIKENTKFFVDLAEKLIIISACSYEAALRGVRIIYEDIYQLDSMVKENKLLTEENKILTKMAEFYGDEMNWKHTIDKNGVYKQGNIWVRSINYFTKGSIAESLVLEEGECARQALQEVKELREKK